MTKHFFLTKAFFNRIILAHPRYVIVCLMIAIAFLTYQAKFFTLDASSETLVMENDEDMLYAQSISSRYEQQSLLVLTYGPKADMFSEKSLDTLTKLKADLLATVDRIDSIRSILDVPLLESPPVTLKQLTEELPTIRSKTTDIELAKIEFTTSPLYSDLLISPDLKTTALLIFLAEDKPYNDLLNKRDDLRSKKTSSSITDEESKQLKTITKQFRQQRNISRKASHHDILTIRNIMDKYRDDGELFLGGVSMIGDDMITFIKNDLKIFGAGVIIFLIIILGLIFGSVRWVLIPLLCCTASAISMIGLLGLFGWEVTVVSSNFISLQLIITMAVTIHLIVRYRQLAAENPDFTNRQLIAETVLSKIRPCVYATLTTIAGFASLLLCNILPVIMFGWMMITGLVVSLLITFLLFPSLLMLMPKDAKPNSGKLHFPLTSLMAKLTDRSGKAILITSALLIAISAVGISRLRVENSFIDYFKKDTEIYQGLKVIDESLGGTTPLDVIIDFPTDDQPQAAEQNIETAEDDIFDEFEEFELAANEDKYWFTADKVQQIKAVQKYLDDMPQTGKVLSLASIVSIAENLKPNHTLDSFDLALLFNETPEEFKKILIHPYVSIENNQARFWIRIRDSQPGLRRNELLKNIRTGLTEKVNINPENIHLTSLMLLYNNMLQSLFRSRILTLTITIAILTVTFFVLFRSLKLALVAMIPNILPVITMLGVMGLLNIPLDMMTITIAAISIGIAVDDTIHYIHRFKEDFAKDRNYLKTMYRCHHSIGYAMYYTSVTITIGFSILVLSNFVPTMYFGLFTGLAMMIALLADLTLLPKLLILTKPFGKEA